MSKFKIQKTAELNTSALHQGWWDAPGISTLDYLFVDNSGCVWWHRKEAIESLEPAEKEKSPAEVKEGTISESFVLKLMAINKAGVNQIKIKDIEL